MSGSGGSRRTPFVEWVYPLFGILLALSIAFGLGVLTGGQREKRQSAAYTYQEKGKERAQRECIGTDPARVFECVAEKYEAADETAKTEQDLTAQQQAAWAGMLSSLWTLISLGATFLGLIWIKGTLDAALRSAEAAERALEDSDRPHLIEQHLTVSGMKEANDAIQFQFMVQNHGRGPAWVESYKIFMWASTDPSLILPDPVIASEFNWAIPPGGTWGLTEPHPLNYEQSHKATVLSGEEVFYCFAELIYRDAVRKQHTYLFGMIYERHRDRMVPFQSHLFRYT